MKCTSAAGGKFASQLGARAERGGGDKGQHYGPD